MSGLELQNELVEQNITGLSVLFMSGHSDIPVAVEALKRGATDFLQKPFRDQELLDHIHLALESNLDDMAIVCQIQDVKDRLVSLTPGERQVMERISDGRANKIIAQDLGISQRTVELHWSRVMDKMGVCSLAHLLRTLERAGFTSNL